MSDARLLLASALAVPTAFLVFVLVPAGTTDFALPLNLDSVVGVVGLLVLVLGPVVWGLTGCATVVALWGHRDLPTAERRLLLLSLAAVIAFLFVLTSDRSEAAVTWWLD
jgi:hypothetical protein